MLRKKRRESEVNGQISEHIFFEMEVDGLQEDGVVSQLNEKNQGEIKLICEENS